MAQKGVVKNGDAFCLECKSSVDRGADRCDSCDAALDEEVKAFSCPRCSTILPLGTAECPQCGMKFRIKTLRQKLSPWTKGDGSVSDEAAEGIDQRAESDAMADGEGVPASDLSPEQLDGLRKLIDNIDKLADSRAGLLSTMKEKHKEEKLRLAELKSIDDASPRLDLIESEVIALADEISDLARLHGSMRSIVDEISTLVESFDISDEAKAKGLAARAMVIAGGSESTGGEELKAREEQLKKREEMVDRKIRGYASKRKELEDQEATIAAERQKLENEKADFDRTRSEASTSDVPASEPTEDWRKTEAEISQRVTRLCDSLSECDIGPDRAAGQTIESGLSAIEETAGRLVSERVEDKARLKTVGEHEMEIKELLKALDQLLGQLPEDAIQRFTQSEDYKLYERVLDRYNISL